MLLKNFEVGVKIDIIASSKVDSLKFETEIVRLNEKHVLLKPVFSNSLLVNFKGNRVVINLMCSMGKTDYVFKNVVVENVLVNGNYYHLVSASIYGERVNRRETPRFIVNRQCVFTPGSNRFAENAVLRDISMTGVSVISSLKAKVGDEVSVSFVVPESGHRVPLRARIVRVVEDDKTDRVLYGCQLTEESRLMNRYIMNIQRSKLQLTGRRAMV